jgi:tetratricopeptide (TPR) repeat protein
VIRLPAAPLSTPSTGSGARALAAVPARSPWILGPVWDLALFIASPLLVIAVFVPLRSWAGSERISLWLLAFFTFGHHLPGFLRAYGDRELFARFRWRFLLAPPLVFGATAWTDQRNLHGLLLLVFAWDIWHVLMQQYGFLRIYDAKAGTTDARTARLDWAVAISWYVTLIVLSPHYRHDLLFRAFSSGVPVFSPALLAGLEGTLMVLSAVVTLLYAARQRRRPFNWRKLGALASFLFASWYLYVALDDFVAGFAIWSAFHCLQYFGLVWAYNRQRRDQPGTLTAWSRRLFSPRPPMVLFYAALIAAWGAVNYAGRWLDGAAASRWLMCFVITSGALHYYYDAFIWKIREPETARALQLPAAGRVLRSPGLAQAALFGLALLFLSLLETSRPNPDSEIRLALTRFAPDSSVSHLNWASFLRARGRLDEARAAYARAAALDARSARARFELGLVLADLGRDLDAAEAFEDALRLDPVLAEARGNAAIAWRRSGNAALASGERPAAMERFRKALGWNPADVDARVNVGGLLLLDGKVAEAEREFRAAVAAGPDHALAHNNLGLALVRRGRWEEARPHLEYALAHGDETIRRSARQALMEER